MAKLTIVAVQHECGAEGLRGQGYPVFSQAELKRGEIVTAKGEKASASDNEKPPFGYVGFDTGNKMGVVPQGQIFRVVREAWVELDTAKEAGTKIYLSNTAGELADTQGTTPMIVGYYIADPANPSAHSKLAVLDFSNLY